MSESNPRILMLINPRASRAEASLEALVKLFGERANASVEKDKEKWRELLSREAQRAQFAPDPAATSATAHQRLANGGEVRVQPGRLRKKPVLQDRHRWEGREAAIL